MNIYFTKGGVIKNGEYVQDVTQAASTNKEIFEMFCKYYTEQFSKDTFIICGEREKTGALGNFEKKLIARDIATSWQAHFGNVRYSYGDLLEWSDFFYEIGKRYCLLREFRENGII